MMVTAAGAGVIDGTTAGGTSAAAIRAATRVNNNLRLLAALRATTQPLWLKNGFRAIKSSGRAVKFALLRLLPAPYPDHVPVPSATVALGRVAVFYLAQMT